MTIDIYSQDGTKKGTKEVDTNVFSVNETTQSLVYDYLRLQRNNARIPIAHTKNRWEVSWSGKKLYRQKWTWSARVWAKRSPTRRHGGVAFWPSNERNWELSMTKKAKKKAIGWLLAMKMQDREVIWLETFTLPAIKTKEAYTILEKLPCKGTKLIILPKADEVLSKSLRNIPDVSCILASYINPYDVLTHKYVIFVADALDLITKQLVINAKK